MPPLRSALPCLLACLAASFGAAAPASADIFDEDPAVAAQPVDEGWDDGEDLWDSSDDEDDAPATPQTPVPPTLPVESGGDANWRDRDHDRARARRPEAEQAPPLVKGKIVKGKVARMRADGTAAIPRGAPKRVRRIIRAANEIVGKPYKWGGGHGSLIDKGYDCSGAVGYALIRGAGLMRSVMVSGAMARWAAGGKGRWVSVYANSGHVYLEVAGLRLDTSPYGDPARRSGVRWRPVVGKRGGFHARHPIGL